MSSGRSGHERSFDRVSASASMACQMLTQPSTPLGSKEDDTMHCTAAEPHLTLRRSTLLLASLAATAMLITPDTSWAQSSLRRSWPSFTLSRVPQLVRTYQPADVCQAKATDYRIHYNGPMAGFTRLHSLASNDAIGCLLPDVGLGGAHRLGQVYRVKVTYKPTNLLQNSAPFVSLALCVQSLQAGYLSCGPRINFTTTTRRVVELRPPAPPANPESGYAMYVQANIQGGLGWFEKVEVFE